MIVLKEVHTAFTRETKSTHGQKKKKTHKKPTTKPKATASKPMNMNSAILSTHTYLSKVCKHVWASLTHLCEEDNRCVKNT